MKVNANLVLATVSIVGAGAILWGVVRQGKTVARAAADVVDAVNPVNPDNIFSKGANSVAQVITGDASTSAGSTLYDWFSGDASGRVATAPSVLRPKLNPLFRDFEATQAQDDMDAVPPPGFMDNNFFSNGGGAATGVLIKNNRINGASGYW